MAQGLAGCVSCWRALTSLGSQNLSSISNAPLASAWVVHSRSLATSASSSHAASSSAPEAASSSSHTRLSPAAAAAQASRLEQAKKELEGWHYRPSRFQAHYQETVYRELMLKCGAKSWNDVPKITSMTLTINAEADTRLTKAEVEKSDLLLYQLALEHIAGRPATFLPTARRSSGALAAGVTVTLTGTRALDVLEKMVYLVWPNQVGFEGVPMPQVVDSKASKLKTVPEHAVDFKVANLLLFPDFERNFELFEPLRSMQVRIIVDNAKTPEMARLLLASFGLPIA